MEKVFVTGATGMVGYHVVKHLLSEGHKVVACVRESSDTSQLSKLAPSGDLTIVRSELSHSGNLARAMTGCKVVIHCAGAVDPHAKREDIFATNVGGTRSALQAAIAGDVTHFIHVSSLSVITGQDDQYDVDENAPHRYCGEAYADSKIDAEKVVMNQMGSATIQCTIVRPGFIYGPMERAWMPRLIESLRLGRAALIDGGKKQTNVIYVENLCRAISLAMLNPAAYNQVYNLTDGQTPTKKELFDAICDGLNMPRAKRQIPSFIARPACELVSAIAPMLPPDKRKNLSRLSRAAYRLAGVNQGFSIKKAEDQLGYTDRIPFTQGMAETLKHFNGESKSVDRTAVSTR